MKITATLFDRVAKCPFAFILAVAAVVLFGISFFFALDQTMVMSSELAKPLVAVLIGLPTLTAVLAIIFGYKCRIDIPR
jgi:hypothetical protein